MEQSLVNHVKAGFGVLAVSSSEETRTLDVIRRVCGQLDRKMYIWSLTKGMTDMQNGHSDSEMRDPIAFLAAMASGDIDKIGVLLDPEPFITNPEFKRSLKDNIGAYRSGKTLILLGVNLQIPADLAHLITNMENELPDRDVLGKVIDDIATSNGIEVNEDDKNKSIFALSGLTTEAAADAVALSIVESKCIDPAVISREKCSEIGKLDYMEIIDPKYLPSFSDIGGLDNVKKYIGMRKDVFTIRAREFGLPIPKGLLFIGSNGCGKSLSAKGIANYFNMPLVIAKFANIRDQFVGGTSRKFENLIQIAKKISPCVMLVDELEKVIGGGRDEHETTKHMQSAFLHWMQEKKEPVYVIATANDVKSIAESKPELLRKGRFDEIFFVDLPNAAERKAIFQIHVKKFRPDVKIVISDIVKATDGFSGAEIEAIVGDAMFRAFSDGGELHEAYIIQALKATVPMSRFAKDSIQSLRDWCKDRTVPASISDYDDSESKRKINKM